MNWAVGFLLLALVVPVLVVGFDAIVSRRRRPETPPQQVAPVAPDPFETRLRMLEDEVSDLGTEIRELRDELELVQRQLANGEPRGIPPRGTTGDA